MVIKYFKKKKIQKQKLTKTETKSHVFSSQKQPKTTESISNSSNSSHSTSKPIRFAFKSGRKTRKYELSSINPSVLQNENKNKSTTKYYHSLSPKHEQNENSSHSHSNSTFLAFSKSKISSNSSHSPLSDITKNTNLTRFYTDSSIIKFGEIYKFKENKSKSPSIPTPNESNSTKNLFISPFATSNRSQNAMKNESYSSSKWNTNDRKITTLSSSHHHQNKQKQVMIIFFFF